MISEVVGNRFTFQQQLRFKTLIENGLSIKRYQLEKGHSYKTALEHYFDIVLKKCWNCCEN